jgi:hypothetical protein
VPFKPDTAWLLLVCSSFIQVVIFPHTWLAHWLALSVAWVVEVDPLELEPPLHAAIVSPAASVSTGTPILGAKGPRLVRPMRRPDHLLAIRVPPYPSNGLLKS